MNQGLLGLKLSKLLLYFFLRVLIYGNPKLRHSYSGIAKSRSLFSRAFSFFRKEPSDFLKMGLIYLDASIKEAKQDTGLRGFTVQFHASQILYFPW